MSQPSCSSNLSSRLSKSAVPRLLDGLSSLISVGALAISRSHSHPGAARPNSDRPARRDPETRNSPGNGADLVPFAAPPTGKMASDRQWLSKIGASPKPDLDKPDLTSRLPLKDAVANCIYRFAYSNGFVKSQITSARATAHSEAMLSR